MSKKKLINIILGILSLATIIFMLLPYVSYELIEKTNVNGFNASFGYTPDSIKSGSMKFTSSGSLITVFVFIIITALLACANTVVKFKIRWINYVIAGVGALLAFITAIMLFNVTTNVNPSLGLELSMGAGAIINAIIMLIITGGFIATIFIND